jgi:hypothetical protein
MIDFDIGILRVISFNAIPHLTTTPKVWAADAGSLASVLFLVKYSKIVIANFQVVHFFFQTCL